MNFLKKYYCLLPLILIIAQIIIHSTINFSPVLNPSSTQNDFQNTLSDYFHLANITPIKLTVHDFQNEIDFFLQNPNQQPYQVIISTNKDIYKQVTALQKLIKIANIKDNDIKFIDLSSKRPYATF